MTLRSSFMCRRLAVPVASWAMIAAASAADLQVEVRGVAGDSGTVNVGLCESAADFPNKFVTGQLVPASNNPAVVVFRNLTPGSYAVSAFHDANGNGKLDKNLLGLPTEKYGFSRDAAGNMGPPSFEAAKITLGGESQKIIINLH